MTATWLDDAIGWFSPGTAARRLRARAGLEVAKRAYDGAATGRNIDGWRTAGTAADSEIYSAGGRLRNRSRDLVRNNPHAAKAVSILAGNIVGEGIMPRANTGNKAKDAKVDAAFKRWAAECDADGQIDFYGMQTLAVREMIEGGEILARRRWRQVKDGLHVPLQIQLLEADYLDESRTGQMTNGNMAIAGIEFDAIGRRAAYWMWAQHPGNNFAFLNNSIISKPVPASEICHLYEKQRTQSRGVPWGAPVIRRLRDIDDYDFAEIIRKKIEASMVGFVIGDDESEEGVTGPNVTDSKGNLLEKFAPGIFAYLRGGKDIKFNQPATVGGYEEYKRVALREVAAGYRVPYELLTGDLSSVNFSSARVGIVEFRRLCAVVQWQIVIPMLLEPWWAWFCEAAYLGGVIDDPEVPVLWSPPKWQAIDPYKDALSELIRTRTGSITMPDLIAENGFNPDDQLAKIVDWNAKLDKDDVVLDSDPRKTTMKGMMQKLTGQGGDGSGDGSSDSAGGIGN
jgi:lambda family phage portal protein